MDEQKGLARKSGLMTVLLCLLSLLFSHVNATEIIAGKDSQWYNGTPFGSDPNMRYSATKMLYTAEEIGGYCVITGVSFNVGQLSSSDGRGFINLKIYMGEYDGDRFNSSSDEVDFKQVYSVVGYSTRAYKTGWINTIKLNTPFEYSGTKSLAVYVTVDNANMTWEFSNYFACDYIPQTVYHKEGNGYALINLDNHVSFPESVVGTGRPQIKLTTADNKVVTVGKKASNGLFVPFRNGVKNSTTQTIYTAAEIGATGNITSIAYNVAAASEYSTNSVKVYMGYKTGDTFTSATDYVPASSLKLVYSGSPVLGKETGWETLPLTTPFYYDGSSNLVVAVCKEASSTNSTLSYYYTGITNSTLQRTSTSSTAYANINNTSDYSQNRYKADIQFSIASPHIFTYNTAAQTAELVSWKTATGKITVPSTVTKDNVTYTVTSIDGTVFRGNKNITEVTIPSSVTNIGESAFANCQKLTTVNLPASLSQLSEKAFYGCSALKTVNCENITAIGNYCFAGTALSDLPFGLNSPIQDIPEGAFQNCTGLKTITLPVKIQSIGNLAFAGCSNLSKINAIRQESVPTVSSSSFTAVATNGEILVTEELDYSPWQGAMDAIGWKIISPYIQAVYDVVSTDNPTTILCTSTSYMANDVIAMYVDGEKQTPAKKYTFSSVGEHKVRFYLQDYTVVPAYMFYYCQQLKAVKIPATITSVGNLAFYYCTGLMEFTAMPFKAPTLSSSFDSPATGGVLKYPIGADYSSWMRNSSVCLGYSNYLWTAQEVISEDMLIKVDGVKYYIDSDNNAVLYSGTDVSVAEFVIPAQITDANGQEHAVAEIAEDAFKGNTALTSINIPASVKVINEGIFQGCINLSTIYTNWTMSNLYKEASAFEGMAQNGILYYADEYCYNMRFAPNVPAYWRHRLLGAPADISVFAVYDVKSTSEATKLAGYDFTGLNKHYYIKEMYIDGMEISESELVGIGAGSYAQIFPRSYTFSTTGEHTVEYVLPTDGEHGQDFSGLVAIPEDFFKNCKDLVSVTCTEGVQTIGRDAFWKCEALTSVTLPESSLLSIDTDAFYGCTSLSAITLPESLQKFGHGVFSFCSSLTEITWPSSMTKVGDGAFWYCSELAQVSLPDNLEAIGTRAFEGTKISSIALPEGLKRIDSYAFSECQELASLHIPASVTNLGSYTGVNIAPDCPALTTVTVADGNKKYTSKDGETQINGIYEIATNKLITGCQSTIIPTATQIISDSAFYKSNITTISLPITLKTVEPSAFEGCASLNEVYVASADPIAIDASVFRGISNTATLHVPNSAAVRKYKASTGWDAFANYVSESTEVIINDGEAYTNMTEMECDHFEYTRIYDNTNWKSIILPVEMEYADWSQHFDMAMIYNIVAEGDLLSGELLGFTVQALLLTEGSRTVANCPYVIRAKQADAEAGQSISLDNCVVYPAEPAVIECSNATLTFSFAGLYEGVMAPGMAGRYAMTNDGAWGRGSEAASLKPMRVVLDITEKQFGYNAISEAAKANIRTNVLGADEMTGEVNAIESIQGDNSGSGMQVPQHVIGLKLGTYHINGQRVDVVR